MSRFLTAGVLSQPLFLAETRAYISRVNTAGGEVQDAKKTDELIGLLVDEGIYSNLKFGATPYTGLKFTSSLIDTIYDLSTSNNDGTQSTSSRRASLSGSNFVFDYDSYLISLGDLSSWTVVAYIESQDNTQVNPIVGKASNTNGSLNIDEVGDLRYIRNDGTGFSRTPPTSFHNSLSTAGHTVAVSTSGNQLFLQNGSQYDTAAGASSDRILSADYIGQSGSLYFKGNIRGMFIFSGSITNAKISTLDSFLRS